MATIVDGLLTAITPLATAPYALFGHSMGGLLAFELARALSRLQVPEPRFVWISGAGHPASERLRPPIHALPQPAFFREMQRLNGTADEILAHQELLDLLEPMLRADFELCETHRHAPAAPLSAPLIVSGGDADAYVPLSHLDAWQAETTSGCEIRVFPGDHFYLHQADSPMLPALRSALRQAVAGP